VKSGALFYQLDIGDPEKELGARTVEIYGIFYDVHCGHLAEFGYLKATMCRVLVSSIN
jgi:hypothetical protein